MFFENRGVGPAEFIDGLSNTVAVAETIRSNSSSTYATDPTRVFLVTGDNKTTGPPLTSDADYATYCLLAATGDDAISGHEGYPLALWRARSLDVQPPAGPQ